QPLDVNLLEQATNRLVQSYDWQNGGWGQAPKFPQPMAIEFLLLRAIQGNKQALSVARHNLDVMVRGGLYDIVGGGFSRYSTDDKWLVPHFEKMLYDNAQLAQVYLHAYLITGEELYRQVCERTLDFLVREMMDDRGKASDETPSGGIFSSLDADSEGEEGKYYLWSLSEIEEIISSTQTSESKSKGINWLDIFLNAFDVTDKGNFEGKNILRRKLTDTELVEIYNLEKNLISTEIDKILLHLLKAREKRIRPAMDDKVLVSWNALAMVAFSEAARYLGRTDYLQIARQNADFLLSELYLDGGLKRSWRDGKAQHKAFLEDYAGVILGLISLYQSDPDPWWFSSAVQLLEDMITLFRDPDGFYFDAQADHLDTFVRPKDIQDNAVPSGNALAALAQLQLASCDGNRFWRDEAERLVSYVVGYIVRYPLGFAKWLHAIIVAITSTTEIAILGNQGDSITQKMIASVWSEFRPFSFLASSSYPPPSNSPSLLQGRTLIGSQPTAYVCHHMVCRQPVNSPQDLLSQLQL
ncbi:MAG: thioredoxin domain-containing protein, partial [Anaerolineales bacterium]